MINIDTGTSSSEHNIDGFGNVLTKKANINSLVEVSIYLPLAIQYKRNMFCVSTKNPSEVAKVI